MQSPGSLLRFQVSRLRRHHALEHATLQILARRNPHQMLAGYSDLRGFWIIGKVDTQDLQEAVDEALLRLRGGDYALAVHPNCGTNFAVSGLLAGSAAWLAMLGSGEGWRKKLDRLPVVITLATLALIVARPLGPLLQARLTTEAEPGNLTVRAIYCYENGHLLVHRVLTHH
jgi:hypothetical protein